MRYRVVFDPARERVTFSLRFPGAVEVEMVARADLAFRILCHQLVPYEGDVSQSQFFLLVGRSELTEEERFLFRRYHQFGV